MPSPSYRNLRIASVIEAELGRYFLRDLDVERALVTILGVEVTGDLLQATVRLGIIPMEKGPEVYAEVERHRREFERRLLRTMRTRTVPHLKFVIAEEGGLEKTAT